MNGSSRPAIANGEVTLGLVFVLTSLVPTYYLPPFGILELGGFEIVLSKGLVGLLCVLAICVHAIEAVSTGARRVATERMIVLALVAYGLAVSLSLIQADRGDQLRGLAKFAYYLLTGPALLLPCLMARSLRETRIAIIIAATACVVSIYGIVEYWYQWSPVFGDYFRIYNPYNTSPGRASSSIGNAVALGGYLCVILPVGASLAVKGSGHVRWLGVVSVFASGLCAALTFSRSAWLATVVALSCFAVMMMVVRVRDRRRWFIAALVSIVVLSASVSVGWSLVTQLSPFRAQVTQAKFISSIDRALGFRRTEQFRLAQYATTAAIVRERPLLGIGFGRFSSLFDELKDENTPESYAKTTENMYLFVVSETGLIGLSAFLALLLSTVHRLWRNCAHSHSVLAIGCLSGFLAMMMNMLFWDALNFPATRITLWLCVGLGLRACQEDPAHPTSMTS